MDTMFQMTGLTLIAACLCVVIRGQAEALAMLLSLCACVFVFILSFRFAAPIVQLAEHLQTLTGLAHGVTAPVMKVVGISVISQLAAAVCEDAGEKALGKAVEVGSGVVSLYASLPLLSAVMELLEELLGGGA